MEVMAEIAAEEVLLNLWKAMRIWDMGEDWEKQGCRLCLSTWKPGTPAVHWEDCAFHPSPPRGVWT